ncbi:metal ABC transporter solute-binding protein, Zn/Mn family [Bifidobacterium pluvialisilvae]|uniref:metal ABC transporter solute-binding protein, Zn/Mn family n=1 Tax=Bifidobacterium pluvialisilvae TaxID=2834436 RepID=UPI001F1B6ECE|nr:zinc ABC transporter substrate-binding protein [Bifidobacterium pluvialisilvae]
MRGMLRAGAAAVACVAAVIGLTGCGGSQSTEQGADPTTQFDPIAVVSSINQWGILAKELGGDQVKVTSILGSTNVDAHDFEPQTSDIATISKARILVANGAGYDDWATKAVSGDTTVVTAADAVGASDGDNPHLWFSKDARKAMAQELSDAFAKAKPESKQYFTDKLEAWQKSETELESTMDTFARQHPNATYAATETVAYYLMSDLKVKDVTPEKYTQASLNDSEPAPADVQALQSLIEGHKAGLVVNNPQEASDMTNLVTGTAHKSDVPVVNVSEQVPEDKQTLTGWMNALISEIGKALDESAGLPQPRSSTSSASPSASSSK